jgi:MinD-like ATPase involved in chromosome partitioning or flagellar assembly
MRIIPVASGKGGVGKTTVALNLALTLSRQYRTVLIDLDAGTSSLRNFLEMNINKDLYHFLKKEVPIEKCMVALNRSLDPEHLFDGFRLIASPKNFISEMVNLNTQSKAKLIRGINSLEADYVIMDIKAGLDSQVLDFLPINNTGILVFTPQMKAATAPAAEMVRAILFRVCRILLNQRGQRISEQSGIGDKDFSVIRQIVDRLEDSYSRTIHHFDDFFLVLDSRFPGSPILSLLKRLIENFRVYFVLNQFNGVEESAENIIKPFVEKIHALVSPQLNITNLGWVVYNEEIRSSGEYGLPYLVMQHYRRKPQISEQDRLDAELRKMVGLDVRKREETNQEPGISSENNEITLQVDVLNRMYAQGKSRDPEANFDFIAARLKALGASSIHYCGMRRILSEKEIAAVFSQKLK